MQNWFSYSMWLKKKTGQGLQLGQTCIQIDLLI